jgi:hypothetical protein
LKRIDFNHVEGREFIMLKNILFTFFLLTSLNAWAGSVTTTITKIQLYETGMLVTVWLSSPMTGSPPCDSVGGTYTSFSMTRPMAKEYLNALLSVQARQATVTFYGANDCIDQTDLETLQHFQVHS